MKTRQLLCAALTLLACRSYAESVPKEPKPAPERIVFHTIAGDLVFQLYPTIAPKTVAHVLELVKSGAYDGTRFWRVEPGFVIQTTTVEDRLTPLMPAQRALMHPVVLETDPSIKHVRGVLSLARQDNDPNSGDSSFSILLGAEPYLDGKYTIFGRVEKGLDVVGALEHASITPPNKPLQRLTISRAEVVTEKELRHMTLAPARPLMPISAASADAPSCHPSDGSTMTTAAAGATATPVSEGTVVSDSMLPDGEHVKTVILKDFLIDRIYPSMSGPWKRTYITLDPEHKDPVLWITRYRAEVLEGGTQKASQEFMCHTKLDIVPLPDANGSRQGYSSQFVISQGQDEVRFPDGYALRVTNDAAHEVDLNAMVLNNNYPTIHQTLDFKATIGFLKNDEAAARHLTPLTIFAASIYCPTVAKSAAPDQEVCAPAEANSNSSMNQPTSTGHWLVPPGRHIYRSPFRFTMATDSTTIHYMLMHVHPYAESVELHDVTANRTVWKGIATNDSKKALLLNTEHYSSTTGVPIYRDHQYELIAVYKNRTDHPVDAMASLWMYLKDRS